MSTNDDLAIRWEKLEEKFQALFNKKPDLETVLMLVGMQEIRSSKRKFSKEEKQDLMHVAVCTVLAQSGYYRIKEYDNEGWPHFELTKELPDYKGEEQENFLKDHILHYFQMEEKELSDND